MLINIIYILTMADEEAELKEFLDKLGEEEVQEPTSTVWEDITYALDDWLQKISVLEERQRQVNNLQERINRTLQQIQLEGMLPIYDFERLRYIGQAWSDLISLLSSPEKDRRLIVYNLLRLFESGQVSTQLFTNVVIQL